MLDKYVRSLEAIFKSNDKHEAQRQSRAVLLDMAADDRVFTAVLSKHVASPTSLNTKNFPSIGFDIALNAHFSLVANSFLPLPSGETDVTANSVHHHGEMLLTTVTTFGPGYEHWRFTAPKVVDPARDLFSIGLVDRELHRKGHATFVDAFVPHAVMHPSSLTITYALWSDRRGVTWKDRLKRVRWMRGREETMRKLAVSMGFKRALNLKVSNYYDYYPIVGGFCGMPERQQFERGPNEDYLHGLFHIVQATGNDAIASEIERTIDAGGVENAALVRALLDKLRRGERISHRFSEKIHLGIPHMSFKASAIQASLAS